MEKYYFIVQNNQQQGPFTLEQLKTMPLTRDTRVWYQGMENWKPISDVPELSELVSSLPPMVGNSNWQQTTNPNMVDNGVPPKTWLVESILATVFCCWPLGIPAIVNAAKVEGRFNRGDIEGANEASEQAKKYMQMSFWGGLIIGVIYLLLVLSTGGRNF